MGVCHTGWKAQFVIVGIGVLAFHAYRIVLRLRMVFLTLFIKRDFSEDAHSELFEYFGNTFLDILAGFV